MNSKTRLEREMLEFEKEKYEDERKEWRWYQNGAFNRDLLRLDYNCCQNRALAHKVENFTQHDNLTGGKMRVRINEIGLMDRR
jgi:hypothetical protein